MRKIKIVASALATLCVAVSLVSLQAAEKAKTKYSMEDIMKKGMKGDTSLLKKTMEGTASDADKKLLLDYVKDLAQHNPEKGDAASWKSKTAALIAATQKVAEGDKSALPKLKEASNCKACHSVHKGDK